MDRIIKVTDKQLAMLLSAFTENASEIRTLRFAIEGECVKVKINGGTWSPPIGELDK